MKITLSVTSTLRPSIRAVITRGPFTFGRSTLKIRGSATTSSTISRFGVMFFQRNAPCSSSSDVETSCQRSKLVSPSAGSCSSCACDAFSSGRRFSASPL